jgi:hypothetical protein
MKKIIFIIQLLLISLPFDSYCCKCKDLGKLDSMREIGYEYSDLVFLGELIEYDTTDHSFTFQIIEIFKGDYDSITIKGGYFSSCSMFPRDKCKWIIYANFEENNLIEVDQCLTSRSEMNPICIGCYEIPPPLSLNPTEKEKKENEIKKQDLIEKAKKDWFEEIEWLRNKKTE